MNWDDKGYLLSKNRYNENSIIAEVFTENYGKISGIIFGHFIIGAVQWVDYRSNGQAEDGFLDLAALDTVCIGGLP